MVSRRRAGSRHHLRPHARLHPEPGEDRWPPLLAGTVFVAGLLLLAFALTAGSGRGRRPPPTAAAQPALTVVAGPKPRSTPERTAPAPRPRRATWAEWTRMYRPLYRSGDRAFGVSWLLLAAVHKQETAFSTAAGTYRGLNFAGCCAGPMQFNVTNGSVSTWDRFAARLPRRAAPAGLPARRRPHTRRSTTTSTR